MNNLNLEILKSQLPRKPYCTDDLNFGLQIQLRDEALRKKYLQINNPAVQHSLIFDIDTDDCFFNWYDNNAPAPNIIIQNKQNGRCHYIYQLEHGIYKNRFASLKATKYASAIESGLCRKLEADWHYIGLIAKNPFSSFWRTVVIEKRLYDLDYLADFVDLSKPKERQESHGLGRNCNLFDDLRQLAYRKRRDFDDFYSFFDYLLLQAIHINNACNVHNLLQQNEVRTIAKSVSKWCFKYFDVEKSDCKFSELQTHRSKQRKEQRKIYETIELLSK